MLGPLPSFKNSWSCVGTKRSGRKYWPGRIRGPDKSRFHVILAAILVGGLLGSAQNADLVKDGDFEAPRLSPNEAFRSYSARATIGAWSVGAGQVELYGPALMASVGCQSLHLGAAGEIYQDLATTPGQTYRLRFALAGNPESDQGLKTIQIWWGESQVAALEFNTSGRANTDMGWEFHEYLVTATSATTRLTFKSTAGTPDGPMVDAVAVVPTAGVMEFVQQDVLVLIYLNTNGGQIPEEEVEEILLSVSDAKMFYERNAFMRYSVNFIPLVIAEYREIMSGECDIWPWNVEPDLRSLGFRDDEVDGVVVISRCCNWALGANWILRSAGYCISGWWGRSHTAWTVVHEYDHVRDSQFHEIGFPDYPCNHPNENRRLIGVTGPDWDVVTDISRRWPHWLALAKTQSTRWGRLGFTYDRDEDGFPDEDNRFAIDENRFGSSPLKVDTDGDGLSDLGELMAGILTPSNPMIPDTDGDGLRDGEDSYPLYPLNPVIPYRSLSLNSPLEQRSLLGCYFHARKEWPVCFYANWDAQYLHLAFRTSSAAPRPEKLYLYTDNNNDGLFHGRDNYALEIDLIQQRITRQSLSNADVEPPTNPDEVIEINEPIGLFIQPGSPHTTIFLTIPRNTTYGLDLCLGEELGIRVAFDFGWGLWGMEMFEPCVYFRVKLAGGTNVFSQDFEDITGWTMTGLWHIREAPACFSCQQHNLQGKFAQYAQRGMCSYSTGQRTAGTLTSPEVRIEPNKVYVLRFDFARSVEPCPWGPRDQTYVQIRYGREVAEGISWTSWQTIWSRDSRNASPECGRFSFRFLSQAFNFVQIRFVFDSVNDRNNAYPGWAIDNVVILPVGPRGGGVPLVRMDGDHGMEQVTVLAYAAPNPVTGVSTTFVVEGVEAKLIKVDVYDLGGNLVFTGEAAGNELAWDTLDLSGRPLANGIYLYIVQVKVGNVWLNLPIEKLLILR